ncbi:MAG: FAD-dependent oxidoreductase, partial [Actinomycetota bacterium]
MAGDVADSAARGTYEHLFRPLDVGPVTIPNRICFAAHLTGYSDGPLPSARQVEYYRTRAQGGVGLIVTESAIVHPSSRTHLNKIDIADPACVPGYGAIVEACHAEGSKVFLQLTHNGHSMTGYWSQMPVWAPSAVAAPSHREVAHAMTHAEVGEIIDCFARAAMNARHAGADGVEVHGAHGYLIQQFLSPLTNRRTDEYGGPLENRMRFALEILSAVREAVGPDMAMGLRISADELTAGGLTVDDMVEVCTELGQRADIDYLSVSAGTAVARAQFIPDMSLAPGLFTGYSQKLRSVMRIPVSVSGRINTPDVAERVLAQGQADFVNMVRSLIADPRLPAKAARGRTRSIAVCPAFNQECRRSLKGGPIACVQNVEAGRELDLVHDPIVTVQHPKRVMVVGAGPAGLEAARVASLRGHEVRVWEQQPQVGGQLLVAAKAPHRKDLLELVRYRANALAELGVDINLGSTVDRHVVEAEAPDVVVLATGSRVQSAQPAASHDRSVRSLTAHQVLRDPPPVDGLALVVEGSVGGWECYGTAERLAEEGWQVLIISPWAELGHGIPIEGRSLLFHRLEALGVNHRMSTTLAAVEDGAATLQLSLSGATERIPSVDLVVDTGTRTSDTALAEELADSPWASEVIGDAL